MTQPYHKKDKIPNSGKDVSQGAVLKKIIAYLKHRKRIFDTEALREGYCFGITTLWLYSTWLSFQTETSTALLEDQRDDAVWFQKAISDILKFDEDDDNEKIRQISQEIEEINKSNKNSQEKKEIIAKKEKEKDIDIFEKFLAHIELFQNPQLYFPELTQRNLDLTLEYTKVIEDKEGKRIEVRKPTNVYSIAGSFTLNQLQRLLGYKNIIQNNTLITINSNQHLTGLFKHENSWYYFNSNSEIGKKIFYYNQPKEVADYIFKAHSSAETKDLLPIGISMFSFDPKAPYPDQKIVLNKIFNNTPNEEVKADRTGETALMMAVRIGSLESLKWHLEKGADPRAKDKNGIHALAWALLINEREIIKTLLQNLDPNDETIELSVEQYVGEQKRRGTLPSFSKKISHAFLLSGLVLGAALGSILGLTFAVSLPILFIALILIFMTPAALISSVMGYIALPHLYNLYEHNKKKKEIFNKIGQIKEELKKEPTKKPIEKLKQKPPPPKLRKRVRKYEEDRIKLPHILSR